MISPQHPAALESSGTLAMPSGYTTPRKSDVEKPSFLSNTRCIAPGRKVPASLKEEDYVVDFEGPADPTSPQNWSSWKKYISQLR